MNVILDASSTINLDNGGVLQTVLKLASCGYAFFVGPIVRQECGDLSAFLDTQVTAGSLVYMADDSTSPADFSSILNRYELGLGESECIAFAHQHGLIVCTDDGAARRASTQHLGASRVVGSLKLLRECVCHGLLVAEGAVSAYEQMKSCGAYLPSMPNDYFDC